MIDLEFCSQAIPPEQIQALTVFCDFGDSVFYRNLSNAEPCLRSRLLSNLVVGGSTSERPVNLDIEHGAARNRFTLLRRK